MAMDDLPKEIALMIVSHLPLDDVLNFRRTCRWYADIGMKVLQDERKRLYLHPTRLQDALDVCAHHQLRNSITEIVIVGRSTPEIETPPEVVPDEIDVLQGEYGCYRADVDERQRKLHLNNHPWPHTVPVTPQSDTLPFESSESQDFKRAYHLLLQSLRNLAKLTTMNYSGCASKPGFCPVSSETIDRHADTYSEYQSFVDGYVPDQRSAATRHMRWSDAEVMAGILASNVATFTEMTMEQPLPLCGAVRWDALVESPDIEDGEAHWNAIFGRIGHTVTQCSITIPGTKEYVPFVTQCLKNMHTLQSLELRVVIRTDQSNRCGLTTPPSTTPRPEYNTWGGRVQLPDTIVSSEAATHLQHLRIKAEMHYTVGIPAAEVQALLRRHRTSLKSVKLSNIFLSDWEEDMECSSNGVDGEHSVSMGVKAVLAEMRDLPGLENAEFTVRRLQCTCSERLGVDGENWACITYCPARGGMFNRSVFDELSQQLQIELGAAGFWNFAQWWYKLKDHIEAFEQKQLT